jgi:hypothetical protein
VHVAAATQAPPLQTRPVPHEAPSAAAVPASSQAAPEAAQRTAPTGWQGFDVVHAAPGTQGGVATQVPPLHVWSAPQAAPSASASPGWQTGPVAAQETVPPGRHGFPVVQGAPAMHGASAVAPTRPAAPQPASATASAHAAADTADGTAGRIFTVAASRALRPGRSLPGDASCKAGSAA